MNGGLSRRGRILQQIMMSLAVLSVAGLTAPTAEAQATMSVQACKRIEIRYILQGIQPVYSQCGTQFTTADPYIGLVVHVRQIRQRTAASLEVLDPDQKVVWMGTGAVESSSGSVLLIDELWVWGLLPLSEDLSRLVAANPSLLGRVIGMTGRPARERTGEWTLRAILNTGPATVLKFTLQAAPGTAVPSPTPTPSSSPSP